MQPRYVFTRPIVTRCLWLGITLCLTTVLITACGGGGGGGDATTDTSVDQTPAISAAVRLDQGLGGFMEVGAPVVSKVTATALDKRNSVTGYTIVNTTVGGGAVTVSPDGTVQWTPNAVDFNTTALMLSVQLRQGATEKISLPVIVHASTLLFEATLMADQSVYSDPDGNITLGAETIDGSLLSGKLKVTEFSDREGHLSYQATTGNEKVIVTFLDVPTIRSTSTTGMRTQAAAAPGMRDITYALGLSSAAQHGDAQGCGPNIRGAQLYTTRIETITNSRYVSCIPVFSAGNAPQFIQQPPVARTWNTVDAFQIDATCLNDCMRKGAPIILIHGMHPFHSVGGGEGTWGGLAKELSESGSGDGAKHDVFEFRWITYMPFEEAAGKFSDLIHMVAGLTGKKPIIIAHSFGGIVSHLALSGQGVVWRNGKWEAQKGAGGSVKRLITLGSPIGGISATDDAIGKYGTEELTFNQGRDSGDKSIPLCASITCIQAGAFDLEVYRPAFNKLAFWVDQPNSTDLAAKLANYENSLINEAGRKHKVGESIFRLTQMPHKVSTSIVVGGNADYNFISTPIKDIGDGLISILGQRHPKDSAVEFPLEKIAAGSPDSMFHIIGADAREYFFLAGGVHTGGHDITVLSGVKEAFYEADVDYCVDQKFSVNLVCADKRKSKHHLWTMNSALYNGSGQVGLLREEIGPIPKTLKPWKSTFTVLSPCPALLICTQADGAVAVLPVTVELRRKDTGIRVSASRYYTDAAGKAEPDLTTLADTSAADFNRADYQVRITMGDGVTYEIKTVVVDDLIADLVQVPNIILQRKGASGTGTATGRVLDQSGRPIVNAMVTLRAGVNLGVGDFVAVAPSTTARVVYTDANGNFAASGLRATEFTVRVRGGTFLQKLQPGVIIPAGGTASQDYIVTATSCVAPLSLQNGGCIGAVSTLIAPTLLMPGATLFTPNPILTWTGGANADHYEIFITDLTAIDANNGMPFKLAMFNAPTTSFQIPISLAVGHQYRWEIRACPDTACTSGYVTSNQIIFIPFSGVIGGVIGNLPPPIPPDYIIATIFGANYFFLNGASGSTSTGTITSFANNSTWSPYLFAIDSVGNKIELQYCAVDTPTVINYCDGNYGKWFIRFFNVSNATTYYAPSGSFNTNGSHALGQSIGTFTGSLLGPTGLTSSIAGSFHLTGLPIIPQY